MSEPITPTSPRFPLARNSAFWTFIAASAFSLLAVFNVKYPYLPALSQWINGVIAGLSALGFLHSEVTGSTPAATVAKMLRGPQNHLKG